MKSPSKEVDRSHTLWIGGHRLGRGHLRVSGLLKSEAFSTGRCKGVDALGRRTSELANSKSMTLLDSHFALTRRSSTL